MAVGIGLLLSSEDVVILFGEYTVSFFMTKSKTGIKNNPKNKINSRFLLSIASYFTTRKQIILVLSLLFLSASIYILLGGSQSFKKTHKPEDSKKEYWMILLRKSNIEKLYLGRPGDKKKSNLVKTFSVKTGIPGQKPTPLPKLLGRDYWLITDKFDAKDYPETAPYFLKLDVPVSDKYPYGPDPYEECADGQCNWELPGYFGLHGINGDSSRLSSYDPGSSGCIRHEDQDITFLYNLFDPKKEEIRYYVEDI